MWCVLFSLSLRACSMERAVLLLLKEEDLMKDRINVILISGEFPNYVLIIGLGY